MWKTKHNKNMATVGARVLSGRGGLRHQLTLSPLRTPSSSSFTSDIQNAKTLRRNSTTYNQPVGGLLATADPQCSAVGVFSDDSSATSSRSVSPVAQAPHSPPQEGGIEAAPAASAAAQTSNPKPPLSKPSISTSDGGDCKPPSPVYNSTSSSTQITRPRRCHNSKSHASHKPSSPSPAARPFNFHSNPMPYVDMPLQFNFGSTYASSLTVFFDN